MADASIASNASDVDVIRTCCRCKQERPIRINRVRRRTYVCDECANEYARNRKKLRNPPSFDSRGNRRKEWLRSLVAAATPETCLEWPGYCGGDGYGLTSSSSGTLRAHRMIWELVNGPIPEGLHVLHSCDNRICINPHHLWLGTNADNVLDKQIKGRDGAPFGEAHRAAKLTDKDVLAIRASNDGGTSLARRYRVGKSTIYKIRNGETWRHLLPLPSG